VIRLHPPTAATLLALLLVAAGCVSKGNTTYTHPGADLGAIRKVAVLPFQTLTGSRGDADKVQRLFLVELLATGVVDVVEPGEVAKLVAAERIDSTDALAPADLARLGKALGADGLFLGTVVDFADERIGATPAPRVTIELRLVEVQTGATAWSVNRGRGGAGLSARLFGFGGDSLTEAARRLLREELESLVK
jgi:TolB-like protein